MVRKIIKCEKYTSLFVDVLCTKFKRVRKMLKTDSLLAKKRTGRLVIMS